MSSALWLLMTSAVAIAGISRAVNRLHRHDLTVIIFLGLNWAFYLFHNLFIPMIEDQISLILQDIAKLKASLKDVKKEIRDEEKIDTERYVELKKAYKEMKAQFKEYEDEELRDLRKDASYAKLLELKMKSEEDIANARQKLFEAIAKLPQKFFEMSVEMESGPVKVQVVPDMRIFLNGKEEKKKM